MVEAKDTLDFWFGDERGKDYFPANMVGKWFTKDEQFDEEIRQRFDEALWAATRGELDHWLESDEGRLALIVLLDQFSRNLYRDQKEEYSQDAQVLDIALKALEEGLDKRLAPIERVFVYLPLEHSEDLALQERSVELFTQLEQAASPQMKKFAALALDFARRHRDMIKEWGRFPYRNDQLDRKTTKEEEVFLKRPDSRF